MRIGEGTSFTGLDDFGRLHGRSSNETYKILDNWLETVKTGDPQKVANLYAEKGVLLGTVAQNVKQGRSVIQTYFDGFLKKRPAGWINSVIFQEVDPDRTISVADGNYTFELDGKDGSRVRVPARFTFVIDLPTGLILTHHSSSTPDGETTSI